MIHVIAASMRSASSSVILLLLIILISGILLCYSLQGFAQDESNDYDARKRVWTRYGTALRATYTMFELTLSGGWPNYARPLIEDVSGWFVPAFVVYVICVVFALLRIVTAIFLQHTFQAAQGDAEMVAQEELQKKHAIIAKMRAFFEDADNSGDGMLTQAELSGFLRNERVRAWLLALGLEVHESKQLFTLLDNGDGQLTIDEFLLGVLRLKGQARSIDVVGIQRSVERVERSLGRTLKKVSSLSSQSFVNYCSTSSTTAPFDQSNATRALEDRSRNNQ